MKKWTENECFLSVVPPPKKLTLERQLTNSIVLGWVQPEGIAEDEIKGYSVYVNGTLDQSVLGSSRTKALLADISSEKVRLDIFLFISQPIPKLWFYKWCKFIIALDKKHSLCGIIFPVLSKIQGTDDVPLILNIVQYPHWCIFKYCN